MRIAARKLGDMFNQVVTDTRRDRMVDAAVAIASHDGLDAVTGEAVADRTELSVDEVEGFFPGREELLAAMGDLVVLHLSGAMREAVMYAASSLDVDGVRALRVLLHAGMSAVWSRIEATPSEQIVTYELTLRGLRRRCRASQADADEVGREQYRMMDEEAVTFLTACAALSHTMWLEPVESIATFALSLLQGMILRWLVDGNDETMITMLDDLVAVVAGKAAERRA